MATAGTQGGTLNEFGAGPFTAGPGPEPVYCWDWRHGDDRYPDAFRGRETRPETSFADPVPGDPRAVDFSLLPLVCRGRFYSVLPMLKRCGASSAYPSPPPQPPTLDLLPSIISGPPPFRVNEYMTRFRVKVKGTWTAIDGFPLKARAADSSTAGNVQR